MEKEKKGLFGKKDKKNSCCCSFEIEEIPEEENQKEQKDSADNNKGCITCGPGCCGSTQES